MKFDTQRYYMLLAAKAEGDLSQYGSMVLALQEQELADMQAAGDWS